MRIGMIGLGKMGGNMAERLRRGGHEVIGYDRDPAISDVGNLKELIGRLDSPRVVWVMVPAGDPTRATIEQLGALLSPGDMWSTAATRHYMDDQKHAARRPRAERDIRFARRRRERRRLGAGEGLRADGGGSPEDIRFSSPIFETLKPEGVDGLSTPARSAPVTSRRWSTTASSTA